MKYRADIDGLRAVAIMSVVLFHYAIGPFSGGFVGVDVFFVISGYLLTTNISVDLQSGRFSLTKFYERRVRRIYPALICVFACCIGIAFLLFPPLKMQSFGRTLAAGSLFFSNILFMKSTSEKGYFADDLDKPLLLHTWSLSIEEQFYLFLPVLLLVTTRYPARVRGLVIVLIIAVSLILSVSLVASAPNAAFFSLQSRAWELLAGVLAAQIDPQVFGPRWRREALALLGLSAILFGVFAFGAETRFPGYNAIAPVGGTACVLLTGRGGGTFVGRLLSLPPCTALGKVSYSLYLWHWPILIAFGALMLRPMTSWEKLPAVAVSLAIAVGSYLLVEQPFRTRRLLPGRAPVLWMGVAASIVSLGAGIGLLVGGGWPQRFDAATRAILAHNEAVETDFERDPLACLNFRKDVQTLQDVDQCPLGADKARKILFWGDSHMAQLYPAIKDLYASDNLFGRGATFMMSAGCPPAVTLNVVAPGFHCDRFSSLALVRGEQPDIDIVFIMFTGAPWRPGGDGGLVRIENGREAGMLSVGAAEDLFLEDIGRTIDALSARGKHIVLALPQPEYDRSIPKLLIMNTMLGRFGIERTARRVDFTDLRTRLVAAAEAKGAVVFDPRDDLCPAGVCLYEKEGRAIYRDSNHVPGSLSRLFEDNLYRTLQRAR